VPWQVVLVSEGLEEGSRQVSEQRGTRVKLLVGFAWPYCSQKGLALEMFLAVVEADGDRSGRSTAHGWGTAQG
jgi:hypothetical protein